jgi:hypothetical protein
VLRRLALAVLVLAVLVVPSAASGKTADVQIGWSVIPIDATHLWVRIANTDDTNHVRLLSMYGTSFDIIGIEKIRTMSAAAPSCSVSKATTTADYLFCNGDLPPGASLIFVLDTQGTSTGGAFQIAASDSSDPSTLQYSADQADTDPLLPATATLVSHGASSTVTVTAGANAYQEVEILPYGMTITKVASISPAANAQCDPEGPGLDCLITLAANATGTITFATSGVSGTPTADVILSGDDGVADVLVTQQQGAPLKYDLVAGAHPSVVTVKRGQRVPTRPIRFTVTNAASAGGPSPAAVVSVKSSGVSAKRLFGTTLACSPARRSIAALEPGVSAAACTLTFAKSKVVARKAGRLSLVFAVACASAAETSCANNVARATIVVK